MADMGIRILAGQYDGRHEAAVLIDSVTDTAFGPLMRDWDEADGFTRWHTRTFNAAPMCTVDSETMHERLAEYRRVVDTQDAADVGGES